MLLTGRPTSQVHRIISTVSMVTIVNKPNPTPVCFYLQIAE